MISNITIGSDPEFFVIQKYEDATIPVPAYEIIPGDKRSPIDFGRGYRILHDNVMVEGNIPPARTREEFIENIETLKDIINKHFLEGLRCKILEEDSYEFPKIVIEQEKAKEFGCAPYLDAWTKQKVKPKGLEEEVSRPAGFHIHVGYRKEDNNIHKKDLNIAIARAFDFIVIKPFKKIHHDSFRDKYYGGYGKMRHVSYGVELRSLGAYFSKKEFLGLVYDKVMETLSYCSKKENVLRLLNMEIKDLEKQTLIKEEEKILIKT